MHSNQKISAADLMWLAGYLEGEGCFSVSGRDGNYPRLTVYAQAAIWAVLNGDTWLS
jgi:hypothetical protein